MKLPAPAWASMQKLAAITTPDILSLDFFVEDNCGSVAYMNAEGVHLSRYVVEKDPHNVAVYFAHEWFHQVVWCPEIAHLYDGPSVNLLTDIKINSLLHKLLGFRADRVGVPGIYEPGVENLTLRQIARRFANKYGLTRQAARCQQYPQPALPDRAATRWLAGWLADEPTLRRPLAHPRPAPIGTNHLPRVATACLTGFLDGVASGVATQPFPYAYGPIEPTWAVAHACCFSATTTTDDQRRFLVDTTVTALGRADEAHALAVAKARERLAKAQARRYDSQRREDSYQGALRALRKAQQRPKLVDLLLKTRVELHHRKPPERTSLSKPRISTPRFTDPQLAEQVRWVVGREQRRAKSTVAQLQEIGKMFPGAALGQGSSGGDGPGAGASTVPPTEYDLLWQAQRRPAAFWKFVRELHFFRQAFRSQHSNRPDDTRPTAGTYEFGGDVSRILPDSLTSLASNNDLLRLSFLADLSQGSLLQAAATACPRQSISLLVDCSGSMHRHYPTVLGFTLALAEMVTAQRRHLAVTLFDNKPLASHVLTGAFDLPALLQTLYQPSYGGTCFDAALLSSFDLAKQLGWDNCTHVMVTDGDGVISLETVRKKPAAHQTLGLLTGNISNVQGLGRCVPLGSVRSGLLKAASSF